MPKRRTPPRHNSPSAGATGDPDLPSLLELERFTTASLHQWLTAATRMEGLHRALYFGLETLRQRDGSRLIDAVRSCARDDFSIDHWSRIVQLTPQDWVPERPYLEVMTPSCAALRRSFSLS
jgi:hypothetical protein